MIFFIFGIIIALVIFISCIIPCIEEGILSFSSDCFEFLFTLFIFILIFSIVFLSIGLVFSSFFSDYFCEYTLIETKEIVAINDSSVTSDSIFLGSGSVNEKVKYYFLEKTEKGNHFDSISSDNAFIIESNNETPRIDIYEPKLKEGWMSWFAFPLGSREYRIYIPENSITTEFNIDLR